MHKPTTPSAHQNNGSPSGLFNKWNNRHPTTTLTPTATTSTSSTTPPRPSPSNGVSPGPLAERSTNYPLTASTSKRTGLRRRPDFSSLSPKQAQRIRSPITAATFSSPDGPSPGAQNPAVPYSPTLQGGEYLSYLRAAQSPEHRQEARREGSRAARSASVSSTAPYRTMIAAPRTESRTAGGYMGSNAMHGGPMTATSVGSNGGALSPTLETITYHHIQEMASKRISTLDYLRKA